MRHRRGRASASSSWPDFFIVGAPRSGTTSLYYYLKGHPDIFMSSVKEPHFFADIDAMNAVAEARGFNRRAGFTVKREEDYLNLFRKATPGQITGEASPSYLSHHDAPLRIRGKNANAKIIVILRNPVDRAYSSYLHGLDYKRRQEASFYEALQDDQDYMAKYTEEWGIYIWRGLYYEQVKRYIDTFGGDQIHIDLYEDLASDTTALVRNVCSFLDLPFYDGRFFDADRVYNKYGRLRSSLSLTIGRSRVVRSLYRALLPADLQVPFKDRFLINRQNPKPGLDPRERELLRSIYHDDILKLQGLIGRDLSSWLA